MAAHTHVAVGYNVQIAMMEAASTYRAVQAVSRGRLELTEKDVAGSGTPATIGAHGGVISPADRAGRRQHLPCGLTHGEAVAVIRADAAGRRRLHQAAGKKPGEFLFSGRGDHDASGTTQAIRKNPTGRFHVRSLIAFSVHNRLP
jgi:hypothetical protein